MLSLEMGAGEQKATCEAGRGGTGQPRYGRNTPSRVRGSQPSLLLTACVGHINFSGPGLQRCAPREAGKWERQQCSPTVLTKLGSYASRCWHVG